MQDRYAGDIGDFGKLALLRALSPGRRLGVLWYLCAGTGEANNDGKHTKYLQRPDRFRVLEPDVFDALDRLVRGERSVAALERTGLLTGAVYHRDPVPSGEIRGSWFKGAASAVEACDLVFVDHDNGIARSTLTPKHISVDEIHALRRKGRALLIYHHQTRMKGGAQAEATYLARHVGIERVDVIRVRPYSSRMYFLFDADDTLRARLRGFAERWSPDTRLIDVDTINTHGHSHGVGGVRPDADRWDWDPAS